MILKWLLLPFWYPIQVWKEVRTWYVGWRRHSKAKKLKSNSEDFTDELLEWFRKVSIYKNNSWQDSEGWVTLWEYLAEDGPEVDGCTATGEDWRDFKYLVITHGGKVYLSQKYHSDSYGGTSAHGSPCRIGNACTYNLSDYPHSIVKNKVIRTRKAVAMAKELTKLYGRRWWEQDNLEEVVAQIM